MATTKKTTTLKAPKAEAAEAKVPKAPAKKKAAAPAADRYVYAIGRRKTATAQVRLYVAGKSRENGITVNTRGSKEYFGTVALVANVTAPLRAAGLEEKFFVSVVTRGGGLHGQSDAAKLAVARALVKHDALLRPILKAEGFLTRDARSVERKKPGLKKARKSPQWSKR